MFHLILAAAAVATPVPGDAAIAPAAATTTTVAAPAARPQRYCVVSDVTGSHIPQRVCHTRDEWLALDFDPTAPARR